jgi:DNA polymerase III subunit chi
MTEIAFHFNTPDKLNYACRLLRKAFASGAKVMVWAEPATLQVLDKALWELSESDFIAHCMMDAPSFVLSRSPIVLASDVSTLNALPHHEVLLSLGSTLANGFEKFERVIELVSKDDADRLNARKRWKIYQERGYNIKRHDLAQKSTPA